MANTTIKQRILFYMLAPFMWVIMKLNPEEFGE